MTNKSNDMPRAEDSEPRVRSCFEGPRPATPFSHRLDEPHDMRPKRGLAEAFRTRPQAIHDCRFGILSR